MKRIHIYLLALIASLTALAGCENEDLSPVPAWETGVHGNGIFAEESRQSFIVGLNNPITMDFAWVSFDGNNTVEKIDFYVTFNESYIDEEGNPAIASHGGGDGVLLQTVQGADLPGSREYFSVTVTPQQVFNLYRNATFNYGDGEVSVFENPEKARTDADPFLPGDSFSVRWELTTADGRVFDSWSPTVCSAEVEEATCSVNWSVVCESDLAGTFDYVSTNYVQGGGGGAQPGTFTGTVTWEEVATGKYSTTDASFGQFTNVWGDSPAVGDDMVIQDACNVLTISGGDQYSDTYTYRIVSVDGPVMTINWNNTYGDAGTVVLTRQDGRDWPALRS